VVLGGWLDLMVLNVFSNLNDSMILHIAHLFTGGDGEQEMPVYLTVALVFTGELHSWSQKGIEY